MVTAQALQQVPEVDKVVIAVDGEEALGLVRSGAVAPDRLVILTDLEMPRMSGLELVKAIEAMPELRGKPVAVVTTSTDPRDREAARQLHVTAFFSKTARGYLEAIKGWVRSIGAGMNLAPAT